MMNKLLLLATLLFIICCKRDDLKVPVFGKVIDSESLEGIHNARVIYNATETYLTDEKGEFVTEFNLGRYLADSIAFYVEKDGYEPKNFSTIVGNTQKDILVIPLSR